MSEKKSNSTPAKKSPAPKPKKYTPERVLEDINSYKPVRRRPDSTAQPDPGDNRRYINHSLRLANLPKPDLKSAEQVQARVADYFTICAEDDMKPSLAGLALAMDVDREYLWEIRTGRKGKNPDVADVLKKAVKMLDLQMVDYMQNGKINPVSGIFLMKNSFGYTDKQEISVSAETAERPTAAEIAEKYRTDIIVDPDE